MRVAGTLLHITLGERALHAANIAPEIASELKTHIDDYNLGAVLVDLPYYENLVASGLRALARLDVHYNPWGTRLHLRSPAILAREMLDNADEPPSRALGLGLLTHLAVDMVFHREIHRRITAINDGSVSPDTAHKRLEDQIDLHVHYHLLQHPGMGTPYARRKLNLKPANSWSSQAERAILHTHGSTPGKTRLKKWVKSLKLFGFVSSTGMAPWVTTLPEDNPELLATSVRLTDEAVRLSAEYIQTGLAYMNGDLAGDRFAELIPNCSLLDGGPAEPPHTPV